jgi:hypothetical protein
VRISEVANEGVASGVLSNTATRIIFRVGDHDARSLADGLSFFEAKDLQSLDIGHAIVRVERADCDFNLSVHRLEAIEEDIALERHQVIRDASRGRYAMPAADVDASFQSNLTSFFPASAEERTEAQPKRRRRTKPDSPEET